MKTNLLSAAVLFTAMAANAQITITQNDMPIAGLSIIKANDTTFTGVSYGNAGAGQVWNLSTLENHFKDTTEFFVPSVLTGASNFPTANLGSKSGSGSENSFYNLSPSSLEVLGLYDNFMGISGPTALHFNPPIKHINLPATYNMTPFSGISDFQLKFAYPTPGQGVDSIRVEWNQQYTNTIDGWGTISTPSYTNVQCLRQKSYTIGTNAIYMKYTAGGWGQSGTTKIDTTINYSWWSNTTKHPLAEIDVKFNGIINSASYLLQTGTVGIHETASTQNSLSVYPSPAVDNITVSGVTEVSFIVITDVTGKLVATELLQNNKTTVNVSKYENGIYFYQVVNTKGNELGKGKFVVAK